MQESGLLEMTELPLGIPQTPLALSSPQPEPLPYRKKVRPLKELEKRYILKVLQRVGGNKRQASALLGITIKTLYNKLHKWESEK
jgi:DNA-binding NtrC family response regulator